MKSHRVGAVAEQLSKVPNALLIDFSRGHSCVSHKFEVRDPAAGHLLARAASRGIIPEGVVVEPNEAVSAGWEATMGPLEYLESKYVGDTWLTTNNPRRS